MRRIPRPSVASVAVEDAQSSSSMRTNNPLRSVLGNPLVSNNTTENMSFVKLSLLSLYKQLLCGNSDTTCYDDSLCFMSDR